MAIIKHKPVKNSNYGTALEYVMFQHNEDTGELIRDELGQKILRDEYYLDGINVEPMSYAQECVALNNKYRKNQTERDVKAHHYIISFDPKDVTEHGLTGERTQALGVEFAKKYFPGFQTIVCTHMDGSQHSGNIHVHIFFNSLRKYDVSPEPFLETPKDCKAGYKHHETKAYMNTLKQAVMDLCEREGLNQVDLLSEPAVKITEQEYMANKIGQRNLDKTNEEIIEAGLNPRKTKFQTQKQMLRDAIDKILETATSYEEFKDLLWEEYNITATESRGSITYKHPERNQNIRGRTLGAHYEKDYILEKCAANQMAVSQETEKVTTVEPIKSEPNIIEPTIEAHHKPHLYDPTYDYRSDPITVIYIQTRLRLVVDLQACIKAQQNPAYAEKVKITNLQQMAETLIYVEEHGFDSVQYIHSENSKLADQAATADNTLKQYEAALKDINAQIHYTGSYLANRSIYTDMLKSPDKKTFRQEHLESITAYEEARSFLKEKNNDNKFPSMKTLKATKEKLNQQISEQRQICNNLKRQASDLSIISQNVDAMLDIKEPHTRQKAKDISL